MFILILLFYYSVYCIHLLLWAVFKSYLIAKTILDVRVYEFQKTGTTLKSAIAAPRRNCGRRYPILLCHLLTQNWQNQKFRCSPETFRLSFYGIQGVPKKIWAFDITVLQGSKGQVQSTLSVTEGMGMTFSQLSYLSKYFCPNQSQYFYQNFSKHWSQDMLDRHMMLGHKPSKHFRKSISSKPSKQTKPSQPSILKCLQRSRQNYELWELVYRETIWRIFSRESDSRDSVVRPSICSSVMVF